MEGEVGEVLRAVEPVRDPGAHRLVLGEVAVGLAGVLRRVEHAAESVRLLLGLGEVEARVGVQRPEVLEAPQAAAIVRGVSGETSGRLTADAGDLDADGAPELVAGAGEFGVTSHTLVFDLPLAGAVPTSDADAQVDVGCNTWTWMDATGDLNGDGRDDLVLGCASDIAGPLSGGAAWALHGPITGTIAVADADLELRGAADDRLGAGVDIAPDIDGDGLDDVLFAADPYPTGAGMVGMWPGGAPSGAGTDAPFVMSGVAVADGAGDPHGLDDLDGDGHGELSAAVSGDDTVASMAGKVCLFHGPAAGSFQCEDAWAVFYGQEDRQFLDHRINAGDLTGDGLPDLLACSNDGSDPVWGLGRAFVFPGPLVAAAP